MSVPKKSQAQLALLLMAINKAAGKAIVTETETDFTTVPCLTTTSYDQTCTANVTVFDTETIVVPTTILETVYQDYTVNTTETSTVVECVTESTTTTLFYTVKVTETETETETDEVTVTTTDTVPATVTTTNTVPTTVTTTDTVPATVTTYTTETIFSTTYDPCPTTCSISAGTVNLYFWPTDRPYSYPSTYVDTVLDYTFVSPSVYILLPTAKGTNTLGQPDGPSTSKWIIPLRLDEVSTIIDGTITRQLTLSDLGTDCPQSEDPTAIATLRDSRCDPILAAPTQVSSWAHPCNACGRFGLFDPPYAIPTVTGGLLDPVTTVTAGVSTVADVTETEVVPTVTAATSVQAPVSSEAPVYTTPPSPPVSSDVATSQGTADSSAGAVDPTAALPSSSGVAQVPPPASGSDGETGLPGSPTTVPTTVPTAAASRVVAGLSLVLVNIIFALCL